MMPEGERPHPRLPNWRGIDIENPADVFRHACKLGFEGIVSKRLGSPYLSGRSRHWIKSKNPAAPAVRREAEEDWGR
jgi:ATP-dependent DNA ligase